MYEFGIYLRLSGFFLTVHYPSFSSFSARVSLNDEEEEEEEENDDGGDDMTPLKL
jgi:hypothetical protein